MAFLHPGPARQPALHAPAIVLWLIGALVAAHAGRMALDPAQSADVITIYAFIPARYAFPGSLWDQAVPFVSHLFLHGDWPHVVMNSLWLLAFGPIVARRFGGALFIFFFGRQFRNIIQTGINIYIRILLAFPNGNIAVYFIK